MSKKYIPENKNVDMYGTFLKHVTHPEVTVKPTLTYVCYMMGWI
jgi:hypothetical protein